MWNFITNSRQLKVKTPLIAFMKQAQFKSPEPSQRNDKLKTEFT